MLLPFVIGFAAGLMVGSFVAIRSIGTVRISFTRHEDEEPCQAPVELKEEEDPADWWKRG